MLNHHEKTYTDLMRPGSFTGAVLTASGIKNSLIVFHGIAGCSIEAAHFRSEQIPGGEYVPVIPTGLAQSDCINGGAEKLLFTLRHSINQAVSAKRLPEVVFILTSDAPSIVGDDISTAANVIEQETGIKIISIDTPGFIGGPSKGIDLALTRLTENFLNDRSIKPLQNTVNIIAPYLIGSKNWTNDTDEIIRLLEKAGITINLILARNLDVKNLQNFSKAEYNLNLSGEKFDSFEKICLEKDVKTYAKNLPIPIGTANTEEWLISIANDIGNPDMAKEILRKDEQFIKSQLRFNYNFSWMTTLMYQKRCGILGYAKFSASLARCILWDFGIIPRVIGLVGESPRSIGQAKELLESIKGQADFIVLENPTYFEYINAIKQAEVDFSIGASQDKSLCFGAGIPHLSLCGYNFFNQYNFIPWPNTGIRGILGLLTELSRIMEETFYQKEIIAKNNFEPKILNF